MIDRVDAVLDFWFEGKTDHDQAKGSENPYKKWFRGGQDLDFKINALFKEDIENAIKGEYDNWALAPRSCLALIILLDQFTRNVYRGTPNAYSGDAKAIKFALEAVYKDIQYHLMFIERVFLYMPLMHAENLDVQKKSIELFDDLVTQAKVSCPHNAYLYENNLKYAIIHHDDIEKYGRFPYRNEVLGRENTPEEEKFLAERNG